MKISENYNLKSYNTFDIDVRCKYFVEADQEDELLEFVSAYEWNPFEILILGGGSNFLFTEDFDGTVFYPTMKGMEVIDEDEEYAYVRADAGEKWDDLVAWSVAHGLGGLENLSLIPGHVGASPVQNVGAYGVEAGDVIERVEAIELEHARQVVISAAECEFAYRDSIFKRNWKNQFIITRVIFRLAKHPVFHLDYGSIRSELEKEKAELTLANIRQAIIHIRQSKLPDVDQIPSAGSFFKNPIVARAFGEQLKEKYPDMPIYPIDDESCKLAAGWLIDQCQWKGKKIGNAGVYEKQALVLINCGGASGLEISLLANAIKKSVFMKFGVWIEPEVNVI